MTKEMGTALMEEVAIRPLIEETMIGDAPLVPIKGIEVAPTTDMDLYPLLNQREGAVLNMEEPKALPMTDTRGHYLPSLNIFAFCITSTDGRLIQLCDLIMFNMQPLSSTRKISILRRKTAVLSIW